MLLNYLSIYLFIYLLIYLLIYLFIFLSVLAVALYIQRTCTPQHLFIEFKNHFLHNDLLSFHAVSFRNQFLFFPPTLQSFLEQMLSFSPFIYLFLLYFLLFTGYGDIYPESNAAKILTSIIVLLGFSLIPAQVSKRKGGREGKRDREGGRMRGRENERMR